MPPAPPAAPVHVAWYAHHSGAGHLTRAGLVARRMTTPVTLLSTAARPGSWPAAHWVDLPDDAAPTGTDPTAGGSLHWAPLDHPGYAGRMAAVATWLTRHRPTMLVVDVSVEVALLGRLLGVPTVVTLMAGDRTDRPHRTGYDAASALVAAWPAATGPAPVTGYLPQWQEKTTWAGAFSRFDDRTPGPPPGDRRVTVLWGAGRSDETRERLREAREATPDWHWTSCEDLPADEVWARLQAADVVVTHAGQNALAEVAASGRPAVVLPQPRPHDEQVALAGALTALGLPGTAPHDTPRWPSATEWLPLLEARRAAPPPPWSRWNDGRGAPRLAAHLDALAARWSRTSPEPTTAAAAGRAG